MGTGLTEPQEGVTIHGSLCLTDSLPHYYSAILGTARDADCHPDMKRPLPGCLAHTPKPVTFFYTRAGHSPSCFFHIRSNQPSKSLTDTSPAQYRASLCKG